MSRNRASPPRPEDTKRVAQRGIRRLAESIKALGTLTYATAQLLVAIQVLLTAFLGFAVVVASRSSNYPSVGTSNILWNDATRILLVFLLLIVLTGLVVIVTTAVIYDAYLAEPRIGRSVVLVGLVLALGGVICALGDILFPANDGTVILAVVVAAVIAGVATAETADGPAQEYAQAVKQGAPVVSAARLFLIVVEQEGRATLDTAVELGVSRATALDAFASMVASSEDARFRLLYDDAGSLYGVRVVSEARS